MTAVEALQHEIAREPRRPELWFAFGNALMAASRLTEAVAAYETALALKPDLFEALANLGNALVAAGEPERAVDVLDHAVMLRPAEAKPRMALAQALERAGRQEQAAAVLVTLGQVPEIPVEMLFQAANRLASWTYHEPAIGLYRRALELLPGEMVLWNNLANSLREIDQPDQAAEAYERALTLTPNEPGVLSNLGALRKDMGDLVEAERLGRLAAAHGGDALAFSNLGHVLYLQGRIAEAGEVFDQANGMAPDDADIAFHRGIVRLAQGDWSDGWRLYESRWGRRRAGEPRRHQHRPCWEGGPVSGKTVLLWSEQGLGDTLQFVRLAAQVKAAGARVLLECQRPLVTLLSGSCGLDGVFAVGDTLPDFDFQLPLLSLPHALGLHLDTLPPWQPYLVPPSDRVDRWDRWFDAQVKRHTKAVGLVWAGESRRHDVECLLVDRRRSLALDVLAPVLQVPGLSFISLQLGPARQQLAPWPDILDPAALIGDFADTAALARRLDAVVCVDTSVAHLAGGLGLPTWMLSRFDHCWRWLDGGPQSPWYPTMTIFRQPKPHDWQTPVAALAHHMVQWVKAG